MRQHRNNPDGLAASGPCRNEPKHRARFNAKGQLGLIDHDRHSRDVEKGWEELGGEPCDCRLFLNSWKEAMRHPQWARADLPEHFEPYIADCLAERERRQQRTKQDVYREKWEQPIYGRAAFLERLLNHLLITQL